MNETSSGNLLNLINDILDLSRIEAGHSEVNVPQVGVRGIAGECADALESIVQEGVVLRRELADVGEISSDPDRLRQVVMNLLGNATKFTDSGSITLSLRRADDAVELSVADTGIGIPPEDLPHIFYEFRQGSDQTEGTGLGLAIAKRRVELLGGRPHRHQRGRCGDDVYGADQGLRGESGRRWLNCGSQLVWPSIEDFLACGGGVAAAGRTST